LSVSDTRLGAGAGGRQIGRSCPDIGSWYQLLAGTEESDSLVRIADRHVVENAEVGAVKFRHIH
jgi:hypothetical protein